MVGFRPGGTRATSAPSPTSSALVGVGSNDPCPSAPWNPSAPTSPSPLPNAIAPPAQPEAQKPQQPKRKRGPNRRQAVIPPTIVGPPPPATNQVAVAGALTYVASVIDDSGSEPDEVVDGDEGEEGCVHEEVEGKWVDVELVKDVTGVWDLPRHTDTPKYMGPYKSGAARFQPTPGRIFKLFVTDNILKSVADASTAYASHSTETTYEPHDVMRFILVNILMGHDIKPTIRDYWNGDNPCLAVRLLMPYRSYIKACKEFHMVDTSSFSALEKVVKTSVDSFWQLGDLSDALATIFRGHRIPTRDVTIDEFTIPYKGRHRARMYNPKKPIKYHFKGFGLNEARTGYCLNFFLYQGRDSTLPAGPSTRRTDSLSPTPPFTTVVWSCTPTTGSQVWAL